MSTHEPAALRHAAELTACLALGLAAACSSLRSGRQASDPASGEIPMDIHSFSRPREVRVTHVDLELTLDFDARAARGQVELELERSDPAAPLRLDTAGLAIEAVRGRGGDDRPWTLAAPDALLGQGMTVQLEPGDRSITIAYRTTPDGQAMQWLDPEQTAGGTHPFVFTQGQSILTRSWIPLQDSPGVRVTYEAEVRVPEGLTAVMSAEQQGERGGAWRFRMEQPIPPYLIALACGKLEFREISKRCGVYAEPALAAVAAAELADTEDMLSAAEDLFGPYRWERYDMVVLPPAFPFGGMENPRLTFLTPTMLAGDKSLVALIAHEMAHSWSGNLVTNATWRDFWLNEGMTTYCEGRIMERVYGKARADMETMIGVQRLEREMATLEPRDQILYVDLEGRHPDDGFSLVPYEKGAWFLRRLEQIYGRKAFDAFLRQYFEEHAFQSITTPQFDEYLHTHLAESNKKGARARVAKWIYEPGIPADAPQPTSKDVEGLQHTLVEFGIAKGAREIDTEGWGPHQWLYFLENLSSTISSRQLQDLDQVYSFTTTTNNEILAVWLRLAIRTRYMPAYTRLEQFLMEVGRRKYLEPLYKELAKTPEGLSFAKEIYARARPRYHAISRGTVDEVLAWQG